MKTIRISMIVRLAMMGLLAVCLSAARAGAQDVKGTFTLPFQAHWGMATLPAGHYSFALDSTGEDGILTLFRGTNAVAMVESVGHDDENSGRCELVVVRNGEDRSIRELRLPEMGVVLRYAPYKSRRNRAAEEGEVAEVIPVNPTGK
jgi:hypothetical protein